MQYKFKLLEKADFFFKREVFKCPVCNGDLKSCPEIQKGTIKEYILQCPHCRSFFADSGILPGDEALDLIPEDAEYLP